MWMRETLWLGRLNSIKVPTMISIKCAVVSVVFYIAITKQKRAIQDHKPLPRLNKPPSFLITGENGSIQVQLIVIHPQCVYLETGFVPMFVFFLDLWNKWKYVNIIEISWKSNVSLSKRQPFLVFIYFARKHSVFIDHPFFIQILEQGAAFNMDNMGVCHQFDTFDFCHYWR